MRWRDPTRRGRGWPAWHAVATAAALLAAAELYVEAAMTDGTSSRAPVCLECLAAADDASPRNAAAPSRSGTDAGVDDYVTLLQDALTPAAVALFDDLHRDLRAVAAPFPERVRERLRPFFTDERLGDVPLAPTVVRATRYVVDADRTRALFASAPGGIAAITLADVVAFAPGAYRPDCIEGVAVIGHELVHAAQYAALGRARFLERYFVTESLKRVLSGVAAGGEVDLMHNQLEIDAYCHQERICRALARAGDLPPCHGAEAICATCPATKRPAPSETRPPRGLDESGAHTPR